MEGLCRGRTIALDIDEVRNTYLVSSCPCLNSNSRQPEERHHPMSVDRAGIQLCEWQGRLSVRPVDRKKDRDRQRQLEENRGHVWYAHGCLNPDSDLDSKPPLKVKSTTVILSRGIQICRVHKSLIPKRKATADSMSVDDDSAPRVRALARRAPPSPTRQRPPTSPSTPPGTRCSVAVGLE